jgi:tRNA (cmo5U34)-methyltransferase
MRWTFDAKVAAEFDSIAQKQIPNYDTVIGRCIELARASFAHTPSAKIIDVGSARGRTVTRLVDAGFNNVYGVEASPHMAAASAHPDRIIISDTFPLDKAPFDMVISNWTLHFINTREEYMRSIFAGMQPGGHFILSDRMAGSPLTYQGYLDFKRGQGVSEADIRAKEEALKGILEPRPLSWYQNAITSIGFTEIEVIDAAWCFNTILCRKPIT